MLFLQTLAATTPPAETTAHDAVWWWYILAFASLCSLEIFLHLKGKEKATKADLQHHKAEVEKRLDEQAKANDQINQKHDILANAFHRTAGQLQEAVTTLKGIPLEVRQDLKELRQDSMEQRERMNRKLEAMQAKLEVIQANMPTVPLRKSS